MILFIQGRYSCGDAGRDDCRPARNLYGGPDRYEPGIHRRCGPVPAAVCVPAKAYPAGDEGGHCCRDRGVREERAGEKKIWTPFVPMAGLVLARVVEPVTAREVVEIISSAAL